MGKLSPAKPVHSFQTKLRAIKELRESTIFRPQDLMHDQQNSFMNSLVHNDKFLHINQESLKSISQEEINS
jgi:hypothetical protein